MKLLANENVARQVVDRLRTKGHDVAWIRIDRPGAADEVVLTQSITEGRVLLTFDKDFGELVFVRGARASAGVILVRATAASPEELADFVSEVIALRDDWVGHFSVVESDRIRMRPLP